MSEYGFWTKTSKLDKGYLGTALAAAINSKTKTKLAFAGILTVTESFSSGIGSDDVGQKIQNTIDQINTYQVIVKVRKIVSGNVTEVMNTLKDWSDNLKLDIILTIGGAGIDAVSVTPDATKQVIDKEVPGFVFSMLTAALQLDPNAVLFRGVCGVRNATLIVNLPANVERAATCFSVILPYIPKAIGSLKGSSRPDETFSGPVELPQSRSVTPAKHLSPVHHRIQTPPPVRPRHSVVSPPPHHLTNVVHHLSVTPNFARPQHSSHADVGSAVSHRLPSHHHSDLLPTHHHSNLPSHHISDRLPTHHHSERLHHSADILDEEEEESGPLTEEDIFGGESIDGLLAKESIRLVTDLPSGVEVDSSDSAIVGDAGSETNYAKIARRPRVSPYTEVSVDKATATIFAVTNTMPAVEIPYKDALNHVLADDVVAPSPLPAYDMSILDGYAVIAADVPGDLNVVSLSKNERLKPGLAVRITTGAAMPLGADAVVPVEETLLVSESDDGCTEVCVRFSGSATSGQYIRPIGSDTKSGQVILKAGTTLGHLETAVLVSIGVTSVRVFKYPVVAIMSYGSNLREPEEPEISEGEVRDSNRVMFGNALKQQGFPVVDMGIVDGGPGALKETFKRAYEQADVIISTGGAAVGENDVVKPVLVEMGALLHFGRVVVKPGAPTAFATLDTPRGKKLFFALAGVPVPAYIGYFLFVLPCLRRLNGTADPRSAVVKVRASSYISLDVVPEYKRAALRYEGRSSLPWADVNGIQAVSRIISLASIDALLILPSRSAERRAIKRGEVIDAMLIA